MESAQNLNARTYTVQNQSLSLLPCLERCWQHAFRHLRAEAFEEAMTEAKASCFVAFERLCRTGRHDRAYASSLARLRPGK